MQNIFLVFLFCVAILQHSCYDNSSKLKGRDIAMDIGRRIKNRRLELGLSVDEVAARIGKNRATVYRYESSDIENLPTSILEPLAKALQTTPGYLMGWEDEQVLSAGSDHEKKSGAISSAFPYNPTHKIPILGRISAGLPLYAYEHINGYIYTELNGGNEYFALRVQGDSMNAARICDNDIIIVRQQEAVEDGEIAVVMVDGEDATVKRYHRSGNTVMLSPQSYNPEHQVQVYNLKETPIRIIGKVVRVIYDL